MMRVDNKKPLKKDFWEEESFLDKIIKEILISEELSFLITDKKNIVIMASPGARRLLDDDRLEGRNIKELFNLFNENVTNIDRGLKIQIKYNNGYQNNVFLISKAKLEGYFFYDIQDITDLKQIEGKEATEKRLAEVGKFASYIAHEIKNPISGIKGVMEVMSSVHRKDDPRFEMFQEAYSSIGRLETLVKDLLNFSKQLYPAFEKINLKDLLYKVVSLSKTKIRERGVNISLECQDEVFIEGDAVLLQQAIVNLLNNSLDSVNNNGNIALKVVKENEKISISIVDDGEGIRKEIIHQIFEPFFTTKKNGTGLGLSIVKRIIDLHKWKIKVSSESGKGTTFTLIFQEADK
jgi:signal transduction histidine kinase